MPEVRLVHAYVPGVIGRVTELHAAYYARQWGFGQIFEAQVATEMAAFLESFDERADALLIAFVDGRVAGFIAVDGTAADGEGAHLRWFIVADALQGQGVGQRLLAGALGFCRERGYRRVFLWTFGGLDAARHIYEKSGFRLAEQRRGARWGREVDEQRFELALPLSASEAGG
jgi:GNAT superfamily N-acetyltransferase